MELVNLLHPKAVRFIGQVSSKKRLCQELGDMAFSAYGLNPTDTFNALQERENLGATGVGRGVALPHARMQAPDRVMGLFMRLEKPIAFDSVDKQPVDLVFALFAPKDAGVEHLKSLALVSRTMRDEGVCTKLRANNDPATLYSILSAGPKSQAA